MENERKYRVSLPIKGTKNNPLALLRKVIMFLKARGVTQDELDEIVRATPLDDFSKARSALEKYVGLV